MTATELEAVLGQPVADDAGGESRAPGMLRSHYAPEATIELLSADDLATNLASIDRSVGVIAPFDVDHDPSWSLPADAEGFGRRLYDVLRAADAVGVASLLIVAPTEGSLLAAVHDRLRKAAAPRA